MSMAQSEAAQEALSFRSARGRRQTRRGGRARPMNAFQPVDKLRHAAAVLRREGSRDALHLHLRIVLGEASAGPPRMHPITSADA